MPLLSSADYPAIRAALDVSLTKRQLPDATIALDLYIGRAMRKVLAQVPDAESKTGDDLKRCVNAAIFYTAAYIAPAVPNLTSKSIGGGDTSMSYDIDWEMRAENLLAAAAEELGAVLATAVTQPTFFAVAAGGRGR